MATSTALTTTGVSPTRAKRAGAVRAAAPVSLPFRFIKKGGAPIDSHTYIQISRDEQLRVTKTEQIDVRSSELVATTYRIDGGDSFTYYSSQPVTELQAMLARVHQCLIVDPTTAQVLAERIETIQRGEQTL